MRRLVKSRIDKRHVATNPCRNEPLGEGGRFRNKKPGEVNGAFSLLEALTTGGKLG